MGNVKDGSASSLRRHPSPSLLLDSESGAGIYLPVAPTARLLATSPYPVLRPTSRPGCAASPPLAVGRAGPLQGLLALQAAQALHVQITRLVGAEYGLQEYHRRS